MKNPHARNTDPHTSHAAARRIRVLTDCWTVLDIHYRNPAGLTDYELASRIPAGTMDEESPRKRRCDLRDAGLLQDSGMRRPGRTNRSQIVWQITPKGILAFQTGSQLELPLEA